MDCSPPGSSVHEIFQARILEWAAIFYSKGSSRPKDQTLVSCIAEGLFTVSTTVRVQWKSLLASPTLASRFFTPAPPEKPSFFNTLSVYERLRSNLAFRLSGKLLFRSPLTFKIFLIKLILLSEMLSFPPSTLFSLTFAAILRMINFPKTTLQINQTLQ